MPGTSRAPEGRGRPIASLTSHSNGGRAATVSSITTATVRQRRAASTTPARPATTTTGVEPNRETHSATRFTTGVRSSMLRRVIGGSQTSHRPSSMAASTPSTTATATAAGSNHGNRRRMARSVIGGDRCMSGQRRRVETRRRRRVHTLRCDAAGDLVQGSLGAPGSECPITRLDARSADSFGVALVVSLGVLLALGLVVAADRAARCGTSLVTAAVRACVQLAAVSVVIAAVLGRTWLAVLFALIDVRGRHLHGGGSSRRPP